MERHGPESSGSLVPGTSGNLGVETPALGRLRIFRPPETSTRKPQEAAFRQVETAEAGPKGGGAPRSTKEASCKSGGGSGLGRGGAPRSRDEGLEQV